MTCAGHLLLHRLIILRRPALLISADSFAADVCEASVEGGFGFLAAFGVGLPKSLVQNPK